MQDNLSPKYATLLYDVRKQLDISWIEYVYLDMVYHLSHSGWCFKSLDNIAADLGIDRSNVFRMRKKLVDKKLIIHGGGSKVKTSVIYAKCIQTVNEPYAKRNSTYAKRDSAVVKTHTKNNNRTTIEKNVSLLNKNGTISLQAMEARIKRNASGVS